MGPALEGVFLSSSSSSTFLLPGLGEDGVEPALADEENSPRSGTPSLDIMEEAMDEEDEVAGVPPSSASGDAELGLRANTGMAEKCSRGIRIWERKEAFRF